MAGPMIPPGPSDLALRRDASVNLPKWAWGIFASLGSVIVLLLTGYFSWLGITTTDHGKVIYRMEHQLDGIHAVVDDMSKKLNTLPPEEITEHGVRLNVLEVDVDELRRAFEQHRQETKNGNL